MLLSYVLCFLVSFVSTLWLIYLVQKFISLKNVIWMLVIALIPGFQWVGSIVGVIGLTLRAIEKIKNKIQDRIDMRQIK